MTINLLDTNKFQHIVPGKKREKNGTQIEENLHRSFRLTKREKSVTVKYRLVGKNAKIIPCFLVNQKTQILIFEHSSFTSHSQMKLKINLNNLITGQFGKKPLNVSKVL